MDHVKPFTGQNPEVEYQTTSKILHAVEDSEIWQANLISSLYFVSRFRCHGDETRRPVPLRLTSLTHNTTRRCVGLSLHNETAYF